MLPPVASKLTIENLLYSNKKAYKCKFAAVNNILNPDTIEQSDEEMDHSGKLTADG